MRIKPNHHDIFPISDSNRKEPTSGKQNIPNNLSSRQEQSHRTTGAEELSASFDTEHLKADLKGRSIRGAAITFITQGTKFTLGLGSMMVLARLLTPADFGIIAMVTAVANFGMIFKDMGLSMATVQKSDISSDQISTLFWINTGIGLLITTIFVAIAPAVAWFYEEPRLRVVTMVLASVFIFGGLTIQHKALLIRNMRFFALSVIDIVARIIGIGSAISAAALGAGFWALIVMQLATAASTAIGVWIAFPWRPGPPKRGTGTRNMLAFGANLTGVHILSYFARNLDKILIGKFFGAVPLGFYSRAFQLFLLPVRQINLPLKSVAIPALSRLKDEPQRFRSYYRKSLMLSAMVGMPIVVFLLVVADDVVLLVLGDEWLDVVPIFRAFGPAAFMSTTFAIGSGVVFVALGNVARQLKISIVQTSSLVILFFVGVQWGAIGVAVALSLNATIWRIPIVIVCFWRTFMKLSDFFGALWRPALTSILSGTCLFMVDSYFVPSLNIFIKLLLNLIEYLSFYFLIWLLLPGGRKIILDIIPLFYSLRQNRATH